ncbi:MAG: hypothetical protein NXY57DRAFT_1044880 [Lentinula lateritia]|nr:MAG: hypothetical protein NXY57DRAFT_1044880 [Lentinula lateritia]
MANVSKKGWTEEEKAHRWWCANPATDPEYQGRGYATRIVQQALKDRQKKTAAHSDWQQVLSTMCRNIWQWVSASVLKIIGIAYVSSSALATLSEVWNSFLVLVKSTSEKKESGIMIPPILCSTLYGFVLGKLGVVGAGGGGPYP